jgi:hypothetical protein
VGDIVAFVLIGLAAVGVAAAVYGFTSRGGTGMRDRMAGGPWRTRLPLAPATDGTPSDLGAAPFSTDAPPAPPGPGAAYLPVVASGSSWHTKAIGIIGIVLMVSVGAVVLAFSVYVGGSMVVRFLTHATHTG